MSKQKMIKAPRGTYDILPDQSYKWAWISDKFKQVAASFNYLELVTPIFESAQLFERSVGDQTDIIEKEMYKFKDRKGRLLALRPEGTAPVVRSYIENNLRAGNSISKLFYNGPMFRYDRPQKGRYRQFYQYGIEYIGTADPFADAEVILFSDYLMSGLGLEKYRLEINSIGCSLCSEQYNKALVTYFQRYTDQLCSDCQKRIKNNPKRLLDCKVPNCKSLADNAPSMLDYLDEKCQEHFEQLKSHLDSLDVDYIVNPKIVRGLDYYNRTAFEIIDIATEAQTALLGGGRYDNLIEFLGGKDTPAIGMAGGIERLIAAMEKENLPFGEQPKPDIYVINNDISTKKEAMLVTAKLRKNGLKVEFEIEKNSFNKQFKAALKSGANFTAIIGEDEKNTDTVTIKNLRKEEQSRYKNDEIVAIMNEKCKKHR